MRWEGFAACRETAPEGELLKTSDGRLRVFVSFFRVHEEPFLKAILMGQGVGNKL